VAGKLRYINNALFCGDKQNTKYHHLQQQHEDIYSTILLKPSPNDMMTTVSLL